MCAIIIYITNISLAEVNSYSTPTWTAIKFSFKSDHQENNWMDIGEVETEDVWQE